MSDGDVCLLDKLPDEVLEFILCNVSQYLDLQNCALVCKRWQERVRGVVRNANYLFLSCKNSWFAVVRRRIRYNFHQAIVDFNIRWTEIPEVHHYVLSIAKRHSHSACCHGKTQTKERRMG
jgi:F-box-like